MGSRDDPKAIMKTLAFFNNKGGVGKTSLLYHLAHMFALNDYRVVAIDLDPQANLSGMFLPDDRMEALWAAGGASTVYSSMQPLIEGTGDLLPATPQFVADKLSLIPGDLALSEIEDELSAQWSRSLNSEARAFRVTASFDRMLRTVGDAQRADIGLIDVGPNLGAINRCALVSADFVVIPIGADLFSIRGLQNVGPKLKSWRLEWSDRRSRAPTNLGFSLPVGDMRPLGYVVSRYSSRGSRAAKAFQRWVDRVPETYASAVLGENTAVADPDDDPHRLAQLKDYRSLMPMAQEVRKPMFLLKPADGAIGGHQTAVQDCYRDFEELAETVASKMGLRSP